MKNIILGTDWWTDCDDAVALRLLLRAHKAKEINLLGIAINACMDLSVASVEGFIRSEGAGSFPLGIDLEATDYGGINKFQPRLASTYAPEVTNADAEDAVRLYRRLLTEAEGKVEILEIGFLQAVSALLLSTGDDISPQSGIELVREKVSRFTVMGGKWDGDGEKEHNLCKTERARRAARIFCEICPVPVLFLGWEIGYGVISGGKLQESDPLKAVLNDHGSHNGRHSWDPMTALISILGDAEDAGYAITRGYASVDEDDGANHFRKDENGPHVFVTKLYPNSYYEYAINDRIK